MAPIKVLRRSTRLRRQQNSEETYKLGLTNSIERNRTCYAAVSKKLLSTKTETKLPRKMLVASAAAVISLMLVASRNSAISINDPNTETTEQTLTAEQSAYVEKHVSDVVDVVKSGDDNILRQKDIPISKESPYEKRTSHDNEVKSHTNSKVTNIIKDKRSPEAKSSQSSESKKSENVSPYEAKSPTSDDNTKLDESNDSTANDTKHIQKNPSPEAQSSRLSDSMNAENLSTEESKTSPDDDNTELDDSRVTVINEEWSADGKTHCVQTSNLIITCHSYDKPHNHFNVQSDVGLDWYTKSPGIKHGNLDNKSGPPTKQNLVKLDVTDGNVRKVNSNTGEKVDLQMLSGEEEIDIDSLTTAASSKFKKPDKSDEPDTLQHLMEDMEAQIFQPIHFDDIDSTTFDIWIKDVNCSALQTKFGLGIQKSELVMMRESGESWLRYLLEAATGVFTGSKQPATNLFSEGFLGETEPIDSNRVVIFMNNDQLASPNIALHNVSGDTNSVPTVLLLRRPHEVITSLWRKLKESGKKINPHTSNYSPMNTKEFHAYAKIELDKWEQTYSSRLLWSRQVHVVHYEELSRRPLLELIKVLRFLRLPLPSKERFRCLKRNLWMYRQKIFNDASPFSSDEEDAMWTTVTRVSGLLRLRGLPLPPYHVPLQHYPPLRPFVTAQYAADHTTDNIHEERDEL